MANRRDSQTRLSDKRGKKKGHTSLQGQSSLTSLRGTNPERTKLHCFTIKQEERRASRPRANRKEETYETKFKGTAVLANRQLCRVVQKKKADKILGGGKRRGDLIDGTAWCRATRRKKGRRWEGESWGSKA